MKTNKTYKCVQDLYFHTCMSVSSVCASLLRMHRKFHVCTASLYEYVILPTD